MKDILLHVQDDPTFEATLESGLAIARACGGHLHCLHAVPILSYLDFSLFSTVAAIEEKLSRLDERQDKIQERLKRELDNEDISWSYERVTSDVVNTIVARAALADLVIVSRLAPPDSGSRRWRMSMLGDLLLRLRTPMFVPGDTKDIVNPSNPAIIAWDGSYEAANAVRASIALLKLADDVTVVRVKEKKKRAPLFPETRLLHYLARHGIEAELVEENFQENWVARILVLRAINRGAGYIVAGGYGHSRVGEFIFGGATRELLTGCPVGVLLAH